MDWRSVVALLANPETRRALARAIVETEPAGDSPRAVERLIQAGLLDADGRVDETALRVLLQESARPVVRGVERFLTPSGRLMGLPSRPSERLELLRLLAARVLQPGEVIAEKELNARLAAFDDDVATLRRLMVEAELLERTPTGTEYALAEPEPLAGA
ncbi:MAG: DUF2087 domain-containing protein [Propionibacteriaceae bacterium]|nr:DUF2087 domain-containing protein [Propionibacteriaceae bacterium]